MRLILLSLLAFIACAGSAAADQTDSRLDGLFEKLRAGPADNSEPIADEINAIWADAASDTVDLLYARAEASFAARNLDLAQTLLDHIVGLAPSFAQGYALRGAVRLSAENQSGAIADLSRAIELELRQYEAQIALAEIILAGGDKRGAYALFQKALEWNPHDDHARARARKLRDEIDGQEI